jgi:hypothetical protein
MGVMAAMGEREKSRFRKKVVSVENALQAA